MKQKSKRRSGRRRLKLDMFVPLTVDECWDRIDYERSLPDSDWHLAEINDYDEFVITRRCSLWTGEPSPTGPFVVDFQGELREQSDGTQVIGSIVDDGLFRSLLYRLKPFLLIWGTMFGLHLLAYLILESNAFHSFWIITYSLLMVGLNMPSAVARSQANILIQQIEQCLCDDTQFLNDEFADDEAGNFGSPTTNTYSSRRH